MLLPFPTFCNFFFFPSFRTTMFLHAEGFHFHCFYWSTLFSMFWCRIHFYHSCLTEPFFPLPLFPNFGLSLIVLVYHLLPRESFSLFYWSFSDTFLIFLLKKTKCLPPLSAKRLLEKFIQISCTRIQSPFSLRLPLRRTCGLSWRLAHGPWRF